MAANKIIIYDETCPMCVWYTGVFVKTGLLRPENRRTFADLDRMELDTQIDWDRSRDEIPLIDTDAGLTRYGIDSMLAIIGQRLPLLAKMANWPLVRWFPRLLYKMVTYNRRAMSGATIPEAARGYGPHFNYFYRYVYLLLILVIFGGVVSSLSISPTLRWTLLGIGLLPVLPALRLPHRQAVNYAGIILTPLAPAALLLLPAIYWPETGPYFGVMAGALWLRMCSRRWKVAHAAVV